MKNQALFFSIDKITKLKCRLLLFLFDALMVNLCFSDGGDNMWRRKISETHSSWVTCASPYCPLATNEVL